MHTLINFHPIQVFTYDGSVNCFGLEFGFFVVTALAVVILFVGPAPFAVGYICYKRPRVSNIIQEKVLVTSGLASGLACPVGLGPCQWP